MGHWLGRPIGRMLLARLEPTTGRSNREKDRPRESCASRPGRRQKGAESSGKVGRRTALRSSVRTTPHESTARCPADRPEPAADTADGTGT